MPEVIARITLPDGRTRTGTWVRTIERGKKKGKCLVHIPMPYVEPGEGIVWRNKKMILPPDSVVPIQG